MLSGVFFPYFETPHGFPKMIFSLLRIIFFHLCFCIVSSEMKRVLFLIQCKLFTQ